MRQYLYIILVALATISCEKSMEHTDTSQVILRPKPIAVMIGDIVNRAMSDATSTTMQGQLNNIHSYVTDNTGKVVQYQKYSNDELVDLSEFKYSLAPGKYRFTIVGEGKNTSFNDPRDEIQPSANITSLNSTLLKTIHIFPARSEWFYAQTGEIVVDESGKTTVYDIELKRAVGRVDVGFEHNANIEIVSFTVGFDQNVIPTTMSLSGEYKFPVDPQQDGSGNYSLYDKGGNAPNVSFFSMPTVGSVKTGKILVLYKKQGVTLSKTIPVTYDIEPNRVTKIAITLNQ